MITTKNDNPIKVLCIKETSGEKIKADICPGCWNVKTGRAFLTAKLKNIGYKIILNEDKIDGVYLPRQKHLSGCPNKFFFTESPSEYSLE